MKSTLLATVAVAALALGGTMAGAQERGGADMKASPAQSSGAMGGGGAMGGAEKSAPEKAAPRAAQSEPNHGASQSGHATGERRAAEQRGASEPDHATGKARAEDRRAEPTKSGAAEGDKTKQQAQQDRKDPSRVGESEAPRDGAKQQARDPQGDRGKSAASSDRDHKPDQAQKASESKEPMKSGSAATQSKEPAKTGAAATESKEQMKSGAASSAQDRNTAAAPQDKNDRRQDRMGENDRDRDGARGNAAANRGGSEDVSVTGSIQVDRQRATRVHDELIRSAPRTNIDITINVGATLPPRVRARPVPASIISISPEFRGYDYVVVHDEIVIVEPKTKKVVTIIESKGRSHKAQRASFTLNDRQRSRIRSDVRIEDARDFDVEVREGRVVPQTVVLQPLPEVIYSDVPQVRDYRYFVDDRRIIIVDPDTREVVDIID